MISGGTFARLLGAGFVIASLALQPNALAETVTKMRVTDRVKMNAWTVGIAGGLLEGAPIRLAAEMARVVDDGDNLQVLPIVTRGATENLNSLLHLKGVDAAIINSDALDEYKVQFPEIQDRIRYILNLFPSELHVFVRPEIQNLQDLAGKKVNFNTQGTAAAYTGPMIFSRLGIDVDKTFIPHQVALEQMKKGEMAAVVFITSKPIDAVLKGKFDPGFKFLPVSHDKKFEDYYVPATLEAAEYPALIKPDEPIQTIAVPTILIAFNWPVGSNRYQRVARFTQYLFDRMDKLQGVGFDAKWKSVNLAATVPGVAKRFPAAQEWLDHQATGRACGRLDGAQRQECVDRLSHLEPPLMSHLHGDRWVISETTSPLDYSPVVAASILLQAGASRLKLSIYCRRGRTDLELASDGPDAAAAESVRDIVVTHSINRNASIEQRWEVRGSVASFKADAVAFLRSLPGEGELAVRVFDGKSVLREGRFVLDGLDRVRNKFASACKWPEVDSAPPSRVEVGKRKTSMRGITQ
jgi:TRAP-type uncharacterized transport system substrate-binding protein